MRGADGARRKNDLAARQSDMPGAVFLELDPDRLLAPQNHPPVERPGFDPEVGAAPGRL